jgi:hypothetical protein
MSAATVSNERGVYVVRLDAGNTNNPSRCTITRRHAGNVGLIILIKIVKKKQ